MNWRRTPFLIGLATTVVFLLRGPALPIPAAPSNPTNRPPAAATNAGTTAVREQHQSARPEERDPAAEEMRRLAPSRREYVRLYRELLGLDLPPPAPAEFPEARVRSRLAAEPLSLAISAKPGETPVSDHDIQEIATKARNNSYHLEFMIALVADPIDSGIASDFDLTMGALQLGLAESGYRLDRHWLPWADPDDAEEHTYRETAGMMLFRRDPDGDRRPVQVRSSPERAASSLPRPSHLLAVFVVGETLKLGIHKPAFERAVDFILDLHAHDALPKSPAPADHAAPAPPAGAAPCLEIPVLGPSYSGSVDSLRLALARPLRLALARAGQRICFRIVSGSASAPDLKKRMEGSLGNAAVTVRFSRTVVPDDALAVKGLEFLETRLGWDLNRAALLVERDTAEGSYFSGLSPDSPPRLSQITKLRFPSGIFALRNAWEANARFAPPAQEIASNPKAFATPKTALEVSLADQLTPVDVVPELSPISARIYEMAMADLLRDIAAEGFSYIGILATDVKDQLFLAEQIRRWAPNVILFVIDNNLLYLHPQYNTAMFGTLTISSFPLVTEGGHLALSPGALEPRERRQFASERQEGIFLAVRNLLGHAPLPQEVWIAASGNYAMWPLAGLVTDTVSDCPMPAWPVTPEALGPLPKTSRCAAMEAVRLGPARVQMAPPRVSRLAERVDLKLLFLMFLLCLVRHLLQQKALAWPKLTPRPLQGEAFALPDQTSRTLMTCAVALLCLAGGFIVRLWLARLLSHIAAAEAPSVAWDLVLLGTLGVGYAYLVWSFIWARQMHDWSENAYRASTVGRALLVMLPVAVPWAAFSLWWVDGGPELFYQRASAFSGGVSPLVSLAWFAEAAFVWLVVELKRQRMQQLHQSAWPLDGYHEPALAGCGATVREIEKILARPLPCPWRERGLEWSWPAVAVIVGPAFVFLWSRMQPIGESRLFGRVFLVLGIALSALSVIAFLRFVSAWWRFHEVLRRLELTDLLEAVKRVAPEAGWKPMHFAWSVPSFTILKRSVTRLDRLVVPWTLPEPMDLPPLAKPADRRTSSQLLEDMFAEAQSEWPAAEIAIRNELDRRCLVACDSSRNLRHLPEVQDFYAIRLIAYLLSVVNQLQLSVMAAMSCGLSLIVGTSTLAFQPKEFTSLVLWATLVASGAATLWVFVQMDRDPVLSAIACTEAGKVTYDWHLLSRLLLYVLPVLGLIASQFPSVGRIFNSLFDPLVRVLGSG